VLPTPPSWDVWTPVNSSAKHLKAN
jgi:hypothetical protein